MKAIFQITEGWFWFSEEPWLIQNENSNKGLIRFSEKESRWNWEKNIQRDNGWNDFWINESHQFSYAQSKTYIKPIIHYSIITTEHLDILWWNDQTLCKVKKGGKTLRGKHRAVIGGRNRSKCISVTININGLKFLVKRNYQAQNKTHGRKSQFYCLWRYS